MHLGLFELYKYFRIQRSGYGGFGEDGPRWAPLLSHAAGHRQASLGTPVPRTPTECALAVEEVLLVLVAEP